MNHASNTYSNSQKFSNQTMLFPKKFAIGVVTVSVLFVNQVIAQSFNYSAGPSLSVPRVGHKSANLANNKIIVMGGNNGLISDYKYYNSCQLYNTAGNSWESSASMKYSRADFMTAVLPDGTVLAIGGNNENQYGLLSTEIYDYTNNKWDTTANLQTSHYMGASVVLNNGTVLVAGGSNTKTEIYNPATKTWSYAGDMQNTHGEGMSLTILQNGTVLAIGGTGNPQAAEIFDPQTNIWTKISSTNKKRQYHSAILLSNGYVLIAGSSYFDSNTQLSAELFNSTYKSFSNTASLLNNISNSDMITLDNNNVLIYGIGNVFTPTTTKCFQEYNPDTGAWSSGTYANIGASGYTINKLNNGKILIAAGNTTTGNGANSNSILINQTFNTSCTVPKLDIQLSCTPVCYGKTQVINLTGTETNVIYTAYIGSRKAGSITAYASTVQLEILNDNISIGKNLVSITAAKQSCVSYTISNTITIDVAYTNTEKPVIQNPNTNTLLCGTDNKKTFNVQNPQSTGTYLWNNYTTGITSTYTAENFVSVQYIDANSCRGPLSDKIQLTQAKSSDINIGSTEYICQNNTTPLQLQATPTGGIWSGKGVTSNGLFSVASADAGYNTLTYLYCGFSTTKSVVVETLNTVSYSASDINYGGIKRDTLCGGTQYNITLANMKSTDKYRMFINDTLAYTNSNNNFSYYYQPRYGKNITLTFKISKFNPSQTCPSDSIVITKKLTNIPIPRAISAIIPDSACQGGTVICKIIKPELNVTYYSAFYPEGWAEHQGEKLSVSIPKDTLSVRSRAFNWTTGTSSLAVIAAQGYGCTKTIALASKDVKNSEFNANLQVGEVYYLNEPVTASVISNGHYYGWTIDGQKYNTKTAPTQTYPVVGAHNFEVTATSRYGCASTLKRTVTIVRKASLASPNCFLDTISSPMYSYDDIYNSVIDKKGNTIMVGAKYIDNYNGVNYGTNNGFIVKYDKNNKTIWKIEHNPLYAGFKQFYALFITSVTVDENNDLYITGGYTAKKLQFAGTTITHTEAANPYGHVFVAKVSESGVLQWFIYSNYSGDPGSFGEIGGADIKYSNNTLYASMRVRGCYIWKNQSGSTISTNMVNGFNAEYIVAKIDKNGASVTNVGTMTSASPYFNVRGLFNPNNSSYYTDRIAILSPRLQVLPGNKLAVYGYANNDVNFDALKLNTKFKFINGVFDKRGDTEFTGIINLNTQNWERVTPEGATQFSSGYMAKDKRISQAVYLSNADKISAVNSGPFGYNTTMTTKINNVVFVSTNDSISNIPDNVALIKRISPSGTLVWKKILNNVFVHNMHINKDSSQIIITGVYQGGISTSFGDVSIGLKGYNQNGINYDLYAMSISAASGDILWVEQLGNNINPDFHLTSTYDGCNNLTLFGTSRRSLTADPEGKVGRNNDSINYVSMKPYAIRIAVSGSCTGTSCQPSIITKIVDEEVNQATNIIRVYPNPASNTLNIHTDNDEVLIEKVSVISMDNKLVQSYTTDRQSTCNIPYLNLPVGIYILQTTTNKAIIHHKLIIE